MSLLKCNSCNIVISEVLAFVQNKIQIMDEDSIVKVSSSSFKSEDVDTAKTLLFKSVNTTMKKVSRKGENKMRRDLEDIIGVFKNTDPESIPIFVAKDLQKLPPLTFDHIDVSRLLKDIIVLQSEIKQMKETFVTKEQLEGVKISNNKSLTDDFERNVNYKRRGASTHIPCNNLADSGPTCTLESLNEAENHCAKSPNEHLVHPIVTTINSYDVLPLSDNTCTMHNIRREPSLSPAPVPRMSSPRQQTVLRSEAITPAITNFASITMQNMSHERQQQHYKPVSDNEQEWTMVQSRKKQSRFTGKKGTATVNMNTRFRAADVKVPFFLYNVSKDVTSADIVDYVKEKTRVTVIPEKIVMKESKDYDSYKILIPKHKLDLFENENLWPDGIFFRRYFVFTSTRRDSDNKKAQK